MVGKEEITMQYESKNAVMDANGITPACFCGNSCTIGCAYTCSGPCSGSCGMSCHLSSICANFSGK